MIADIIKNRHLYYAISPRIKTALEYIAETDFSAVEPGKIELDGSDIYALIQEYDSIPIEEGKWECHRRYIDIQYIAEGVEQIGCNNILKMSVKTEYSPGKDIEFLSGPGDFITFHKGSFAIFFPEDAHQAKIAPDDVPGPVKKILVKIKTD